MSEGPLAETGESLTLVTHARVLHLSRAAILADDADALNDLARHAAQAALAAEDDLFFASLAANPTLRDGVAFFSAATHANVGSAGVLSATSLGEALALLRSQRSGAGAVMNLEPRYLLAPPVSEVLARSLVRDIELRAGAPLEVITDAHLPGTVWYLFAAPERMPAFASGYLSATRLPQLIATPDFRYDGLAFRVMHDFGVGPFNFRAAVRAPGA